MILLNLCIAFVAVSCLGCWCQGEDQPEKRLVKGEAPIGSIQPSLKYWNIQEGKRHRQKSPNVHIENISVPQRTQNSETFGKGHLVNAYPKIAQYYSMQDDSDILEKQAKVDTKPKLSLGEPQIPVRDSETHSQASQVIYGQMNAEQDNGYFTVPYFFVNQPNSLASMLSSTGGKNPYFFILNSPYPFGLNMPKPQSPSAANEDDDSEMEPSTAQLTKPKHQLNQHKASLPYVKVSQQSFDNLGLSVAKYLLGHPLYSANDMENLRSHSNKLNAENTHSEGETSKDKGDHNVIEVVADDDYIPEADELTTKDVKLPLEFLWDIERSQKKVDDRMAVIYLRHTKKGRNIQLEQ